MIPFAARCHFARRLPKGANDAVRADGPTTAGFIIEYPLRGWKKINLEKIEFMSVMVYPPTF